MFCTHPHLCALKFPRRERDQRTTCNGSSYAHHRYHKHEFPWITSEKKWTKQITSTSKSSKQDPDPAYRTKHRNRAPPSQKNHQNSHARRHSSTKGNRQGTRGRRTRPICEKHGRNEENTTREHTYTINYLSLCGSEFLYFLLPCESLRRRSSRRCLAMVPDASSPATPAFPGSILRAATRAAVGPPPEFLFYFFCQDSVSDGEDDGAFWIWCGPTGPRPEKNRHKSDSKLPPSPCLVWLEY